MINTESLRITIKGFVLAINMHQVFSIGEYWGEITDSEGRSPGT